MLTARFLQLFTGLCATAVSCHPQPQAPRFHKVVMVHGMFENGQAFDSLKRRLETHGIECYVPQMKPADGRGGLENLAARLKSDIDAKFGQTAKIAVVSFSMGGLVSRYYLQNLGGAERCDFLITISSPHHGTTAAYAYPSAGALQMRPGSEFLRALGETENALGTMPIVSYRTPFDLMILPATSSVWARAENVSYRVALHPLMLHTPAVLDDVEQRLLAHTPDISP